MALRRFDIEAGGDAFAFKADTEPTIKFWLAKYPEERKRSAVIPLLWLAQKDNEGWLSEPAMRYSSPLKLLDDLRGMGEQAAFARREGQQRRPLSRRVRHSNRVCS